MPTIRQCASHPCRASLTDHKPMAFRPVGTRLDRSDVVRQGTEAEALATITAARMEDFISTNICCRFGIPYAIITDKDRQFDSEVFR
ncbi:unnamed protein product [Prunus armeniaca]